jgi:hypothetical protein
MRGMVQLQSTHVISCLGYQGYSQGLYRWGGWFNFSLPMLYHVLDTRGIVRDYWRGGWFSSSLPVSYNALDARGTVMDCRIVCKGMGLWDLPADKNKWSIYSSVIPTCAFYRLDSKAYVFVEGSVQLRYVDSESPSQSCTIVSNYWMVMLRIFIIQVNKTESAKIPLLLFMFPPRLKLLWFPIFAKCENIRDLRANSSLSYKLFFRENLSVSYTTDIFEKKETKDNISFLLKFS